MDVLTRKVHDSLHHCYITSLKIETLSWASAMTYQRYQHGRVSMAPCICAFSVVVEPLGFHVIFLIHYEHRNISIFNFCDMLV